MNRVLKGVTALVVAVISVFGLTACSEQTVDMSQYAAVIDVRTPEEFATGHLTGAVLMNFQDADFEDQIQALDKSANYFIYCRSGNRAGQAIEVMKQAGFTGNLLNAGSVENASAISGISIER